MTTVAGVELYNNTAKLVEFSKKLFENEEYGEETVAGVRLYNNTALQRKVNAETYDVTTLSNNRKKTVRK